MGIWYGEVDQDKAQTFRKGTLLDTLDINITELGDDYIKGTMPVDQRTRQTYGVLHGGASCALAETLGSIGAHLVVDSSKFFTVGMEINANHLCPVMSGIVTGTAKPIHLGRTSQVWGIEIVNENGKMVCISRITMAVVPREKLEKKK
ncbi:MAG: hotdog fold thioesterase [Flavobacteriales bacterium]|jgi:1,4-dihydroxy-2-naphthoyl-CoA hydrolase|nr:hotdog fold thioesterase [Flavobacteriales bacterium]MBT3963731.1 hotdog fold thioesterase [Flavobacteriales bacterium]MBT4703966.1 hotdog fold thioesterase [Flavobacteriales bacterium]MBT4930338.1 hotdog fold thioesterase [Flavobacteriales bacterium]MBT5132561.1 hotdog fold thioesterase [Flavobacteriales bacterium]